MQTMYGYGVQYFCRDLNQLATVILFLVASTWPSILLAQVVVEIKTESLVWLQAP